MRVFKKKAFTDFKEFGWRSVLIIGVIVLTLGGSLAFFYTIITSPIWMDNYFDEYNHADYIYQFNDNTWINQSQLDNLEYLDEIDAYTGRLFWSTYLKLPGEEESKYILFVGLDDDLRSPEVYKYSIVSGDNFNEDNNERNAVIDHDFAEENDIDLEDKISITGLNGAKLKISGTCKAPEFLMLTSNPEYTIPIKGSMAVCYLSKDTLKNYIIQYFIEYNSTIPTDLTHIINYYKTVDYNNLAVTFKEDVEITDGNDAVEDYLEDKCGVHIDKSEEFEDSRSYSEFIGDMAKGAQFVSILLVFMILMGILITYVIFNRYIFNQQQQIGILLGLGYSKSDINSYFFSIFALVSFIAIPLSILLGYSFGWMLLSVMISRMANLPRSEISFIFLPEIIIIGIIMGSLMIFTSIYIPLRKVKFNLINELIYGQSDVSYRIKKGIKKIKKKQKVSNRLIKRNLFKNKKRAVFTTIAMTFSLLIISATQTLIDSLYYNAYRIFQSSENNVQANEIWDLNVDFQNAINKSEPNSLIDRIDALRGTEEIEIYSKGRVTAKGEEDESFPVIGYDLENTKMHYFTWEGKKEDNAIPKKDNEIAISTVYAQKLDKQVGDSIKIENAGGDKFKFKIVGIHRELILTGYVNFDAGLEIFHNYSNFIDGLYILLKDDADKDEIIEDIYDMGNIEIIFDSEEMSDTIIEYYNSYIPLLSLIVYYSLVLSFFIVFYNAVMNVFDKNYEYGIMRSLGFSKTKVFRLILIENVLQGIISIILAIAFTYPLSLQLASIFQRESPFEVIIGIPAILMIVIPPLFLLTLGSLIGLYAVYRSNLYEQVQTRYIG
jgi:putative ABC transport system permease protein